VKNIRRDYNFIFLPGDVVEGKELVGEVGEGAEMVEETG